MQLWGLGADLATKTWQELGERQLRCWQQLSHCERHPDVPCEEQLAQFHIGLNVADSYHHIIFNRVGLDFPLPKWKEVRIVCCTTPRGVLRITFKDVVVTLNFKKMIRWFHLSISVGISGSGKLIMSLFVKNSIISNSFFSYVHGVNTKSRTLLFWSIRYFLFKWVFAVTGTIRR